MPVEENLQANVTGTLDNAIHECQSLESFEVRVQLVVDTLRYAGRVEELIGVGQANGVEAFLCDLLQHVLPVARPQSMRGKGTGLKPKPVDACERHLAPRRRIHQLTMRGTKEPDLMTGLALRGDFLRSRNRDFRRNMHSNKCIGSQDHHSQIKERHYAPPPRTCYAGTFHIALPFHVIEK